MKPDEPGTGAKPAEEGAAAREYAVVLLRDGQPVWPEALHPTVRPRRAWRGAVLVALVVAIGWLWRGEREEAVPLQARPPAPVVAALQVTAPAEGVPSPPPIEPAASAAQDEPALEICGRGRVTREQIDKAPELLDDWVKAARGAALEPTLARMMDSDVPRTRAAALAMTALGSRWDAADTKPAAAEGACPRGDCVDDVPKESAARGALSKLVTASNDPAVVQFALMACHPSDWSRGSPCMRPIVEHWVQIEQGNASAWMHLAAMARARKDEPSLAIAMQGVAGASVVDTRFGLFAHEMTRLVDPRADPFVGLGLLVKAIGMEAATVAPLQPVSKHCEASALNDGNRRNECERIAMLFTEHSRQLIDFSIGIALGKRLGWSADRIERLEVQKEAMFQAGTRPLPDAAGVLVDPLDITSCRGIERQRAWVRDLAEIGEVAALRKRIAASGMTEAHLAAQAREARRTSSDAVVIQPAADRPKSEPLALR